MAKAIKCRLIICGRRRQIDMGVFDSISAAKKYAAECITQPFRIIKIQ